MKYAMIIAALFTAGIMYGCGHKVLLESHTEQTPLAGYNVPSDGLVAAIIQALPETEEELLSCAEDNATLTNGPASLLLAREVAQRKGRSLWFVRPALQPRCWLFYGARSFEFWFVTNTVDDGGENYALVLNARADSAEVMDTAHNGLNDIVSRYCSAAGCDVKMYIFDGLRYSLHETFFEKRAD